MLAHVKRSYESNQDLSASTAVPSHGWIERERREREVRKGTIQHADVEDKVEKLDTETLSRVLADVHGTQSSVKFEIQDDNRSINVRAQPNTLRSND